MVESRMETAEFRIGRVLSQGISVFFRNILAFGAIAVLAMSPLLFYVLLVDPWVIFGDDSGLGTELITRVVEGVVGGLIAAAVVYGTSQDLRGRRAGLADCLGRGLAVIFPVLGVALVVNIMISLATLALIIPGLIVATMLWVAIPAAVLEKKGLGALSRSTELTSGYRWKIFGLIILLGALLLIPIVVMGGLFALFEDNIAALNLILMVFVAFYYTFSAVISTVGYHSLRLVKEGGNLEDIASVFD